MRLIRGFEKRKGFTLIELLVVIAIIAILAAILFPVFQKARDKAKTSTCLAHGRELGEASMMYMGDWDDRFPSSASNAQISELTKRINNHYDWPGTPSVDESGNVWSMGLAQYKYIHLYRYVKNDKIWICPNPAGLYGKRYAFGYLCSWLPRSTDDFVDGDRGFHDDEGRGRTIADVEAKDAKGETACGSRYMPPTKKIMWMCYGLGPWAKTHVGTGSWAPNVFPDFPHQGGSTYVYADGHAAWKKMGKAWAPVGYTKLDIDQDPGMLF